MSFPFSEALLISTFVLLVPLCLYFKSSRSNNPAMLHTNWPILYRFPSLMANLHNLHDYLTVVLAGSGHNFRAHGPPGTGMRLFITCDPANVKHIYTTNYTNFPKGAEFAAIFEFLDGSLFTMDGEASHRHHAIIKSLFSSPWLAAGVAARCRDKVENVLLPFFSGMAYSNTSFDMQELIARFIIDLATETIFSVDPGFLSSDSPPMDALTAMDTVMEVGLFRHSVPAFCWKGMRRLNIGPERKLRTAHTVLREFYAEMMERTKIKGTRVGGDQEEQECVDIRSFLMKEPEHVDQDLVRPTIIGILAAMRDTVGATLPWIFYNLAQNPHIVSIIRSELSPIASCKETGADAMVIFEPDETKALVYLRAVLYETLRLYPAAPFERKTVAADDIMPSGHEVRAGDTVIISLHSMGRMEGVWGKDCLDYKPDRWLSEDGSKLRHVPSHKFLAFNSGPRMCPGKEIAVMEMKTIVAAVVWNFDVEMVEGQMIQPKKSCISQMKNGLTLKLKKREL